jgi:hypothetical protein
MIVSSRCIVVAAVSAIAASLFLFFAPKHGYVYAMRLQFRTQFLSLSRIWRRPRIVMLGDSLTVEPDWSALMGCHGAIANYGIEGNTSADVLTRLDPILFMRPVVVFLLIGTNDVRLGIPSDETVQNIKRIVRRLARSSIRTIGLQPPPLHGSQEPSRRMAVAMGGHVFRINFAKEDMRRDGVHLNPDAYVKWRNAIASTVHGFCEAEQDLAGR